MSRLRALFQRAGLFGLALVLLWAAALVAQPVTNRVDGNLLVTGALTVIGGSAATGNVTLPENSVGPDELNATQFQVILCGELAENGATFLGPSTGAFGGNGADLSIGSTACDALDSTTEATADAPIFSAVAFKVTGMYCKTDGTLGADETLTYALRTAAGATTPSVTCAIAEAGTECRATTGTTTDIAAGATIAVSATEVSNNADDNGWCMVFGSMQ